MISQSGRQTWTHSGEQDCLKQPGPGVPAWEAQGGPRAGMSPARDRRTPLLPRPFWGAQTTLPPPETAPSKGTNGVSAARGERPSEGLAGTRTCCFLHLLSFPNHTCKTPGRRDATPPAAGDAQDAAAAAAAARRVRTLRAPRRLGGSRTRRRSCGSCRLALPTAAGRCGTQSAAAARNSTSPLLHQTDINLRSPKGAVLSPRSQPPNPRLAPHSSSKPDLIRTLHLRVIAPQYLKISKKRQKWWTPDRLSMETPTSA